ncbi:MAG: pyruvate kinase, partial [Bacilli bacterium]
MKKTKIVCTLGPACNDEATMRHMLLSGMNVARFNFSHGTHEEHKKRMDLFRMVRDELAMPAALLLDTKGPEIRIKKFVNDAVVLVNEQLFTLTIDDVLGDETRVAITYRNLVRDILPGCKVLIDDGKVEMIVETITETNIKCRVTRGGKLSN